jgi:hypothetical protein
MRRVSQVKIDFWSKHHKAAEIHPAGIGSYCNEQKISSTMYYKWKKKIALVRSKELKPVFLPVEIKEAKNSIEMVALLKKRHAILPEAKWVAEVLSHLIREFQ